MKNAFYFPHFCTARNDSKLSRLRRILGWDAYGLYFALLEVLREQTGFKYPIHGLEDLAFDWHIGKEKLISIVNDFGLFEIDSNDFFSPKLIEYLTPYIQRSERAKAAINKRWQNVLAEKEQTKIDTNSNTNVLPAYYVGNTIKEKKRKENKIKDKKENKEKSHAFNASPYFDFDLFKNSIGEKYQVFDLEYYYNALKNYSESKGATYLDWIAAARQWILRDINKNEARIIQSTGKTSDEKLKEITRVFDELQK